jgi:hypothetical protein
VTLTLAPPVDDLPARLPSARIPATSSVLLAWLAVVMLGVVLGLVAFTERVSPDGGWGGPAAVSASPGAVVGERASAPSGWTSVDVDYSWRWVPVPEAEGWAIEAWSRVACPTLTVDLDVWGADGLYLGTLSAQSSVEAGHVAHLSFPPLPGAAQVEVAAMGCSG